MHPTAARLRSERALGQHSAAITATVVAPAIGGAHCGGRTSIVTAPHAAATMMQVSKVGRLLLDAKGDPKMGDPLTISLCGSPACSTDSPVGRVSPAAPGPASDGPKGHETDQETDRQGRARDEDGGGHDPLWPELERHDEASAAAGHDVPAVRIAVDQLRLPEGPPARPCGLPAGVEALTEHEPEGPAGALDLELGRSCGGLQHSNRRGRGRRRFRGADRPRRRCRAAVGERGEGGAARSRVEHEPVEIPARDLSPHGVQRVGAGAENDAFGVGPAPRDGQALELLGGSDGP